MKRRSHWHIALLAGLTHRPIQAQERGLPEIVFQQGRTNSLQGKK